MVAAAGATIVAIAALVVSVKSLSIQKESARAATISAEAAQRANVLTEQRLQRELEHHRDRRSEPEAADDAAGWSGPLPEVPAQGGPDAGPAPMTVTAPTDVRDQRVRWTLDRRGRNGYVLRNVGAVIAEEVRIPPEALPPVARNLPESATLRPNESVEFVMVGVWGSPVPNEIPVIWKDNPDGVLVPVPGS